MNGGVRLPRIMSLTVCMGFVGWIGRQLAFLVLASLHQLRLCSGIRWVMPISCGGSRSDFQDEQTYFLHNSQVMVFLFAAEEGCACSCFAHYFSGFRYRVVFRFPVFLCCHFHGFLFSLFSVLPRFLFSYPVCFLIFSSFSLLSFPADFFSDWNLRCDTPRLGLFVEWYFDKISKKVSEGFLERFCWN